jgi:hypothetical protein
MLLLCCLIGAWFWTRMLTAMCVERAFVPSLFTPTSPRYEAKLLSTNIVRSSQPWLKCDSVTFD